MNWKTHGPAQRRLVHRLIDEALIHERLGKYPAIKRTFPWKRIVACKNKGPYFCHYMGWRLGTWIDESPFERLNTLLERAKQMENWRKERERVGSSEFGDFWSLLWTLQVAELLAEEGQEPRWMKQGPDLQVADGWYVECYTLRKSFAIYNFIEDVLSRVHPDLEASYQKGLRFKLPQDRERESFLDKALGPVSDCQAVEDAIERAKMEYPVVLYKHSSSLVIYAQGHHIDAYVPNRVTSTAGRPEYYARVVLNEVTRAKQGENALRNHRPNIVVANLLLSTDWQMGDQEALVRECEAIGEEDDSGVDALAVATAGIDQIVEKETLTPVWCTDRAAPVVQALTGRGEPFQQV